MHIKHLKHGTGSGSSCSTYLKQKLDSTGKERELVQVLKGDPDATAAVADSLDFKFKYTSGVISWSPDDKPTMSEIKEVLDDYEKVAFAGLEPDRYSFSAVLHVEKDKGVHVHTFNARVDLATGKSLNIAPPGHLMAFDSLRDFYNHSKGWDRPDDPNRARLVQPGFHAYVDADKVRRGMQVEKDPRQLITNYLVEKIMDGEINNRDDIIDAIHEAGLETPRINKTFITIKDPESGVKFRVKGAIYGADFKREDFERSIAEEDGRRQGKEQGLDRADRGIDREAAQDALKKFNKHCESRSAFNAERYKIRDGAGPGGHSGGDRGSLQDRQGTGLDHKETVDRDVSDRLGALAEHLRGELGSDAISNRPDPRELDRDPGTDTDSKPDEDTGYHLRPKPTGDIRSSSTGDDNLPGLQNRPKRGTTTKKEIEDYGTNRIGTIAHPELAEITNRADQNNRILADTSIKLNRACEPFNNGLQRSIQNIRRNGGNVMNGELDRFKSDVNLVEYAASKGFELDRRKSGNNSKVMVRGDEKIGISRHKSTGHDVYNNFGIGAGGGGTCIDFAQKLGNVGNLGNVRKEFRSFLGSPRPEVSELARVQVRPTEEIRAEVLKREVGQAKPYSPVSESYLVRSRKLSLEILGDPRFKNRVFIDNRNNALFPHYSHNKGLVGYEKKNDKFNGFTPHAEKALWYSNAPENMKEIVVCESVIDCISHAQLYPDNADYTAYVSIAGKMSLEQEKELEKLIERSPDVRFVSGFDNDDAGNNFHQDLNFIAGPDREIKQELPKSKDWNQDLKNEFNVEQELRGLER